jgi:hypothetical protein
MGVVACGGSERDSTAGGGARGEPILIKTQVTIHIPYRPREFTGEVLGGSAIGDSPFCPRGRFRDRHGNAGIGLVDRTFRCPDGSLRIGFTPGAPKGRTQAGPWKILSGNGAFERLRGQGQMNIKYERGSSSKGRETFTGRVAH